MDKGALEKALEIQKKESFLKERKSELKGLQTSLSKSVKEKQAEYKKSFGEDISDKSLDDLELLYKKACSELDSYEEEVDSSLEQVDSLMKKVKGD